MDASTVDVAVWNIEADGGRNRERRDLALDILAEYNPDVVLQQEARHSRERGELLLHATEKRLKLRGFLAAPNPYADADIATAVYIRPEMFQVAEARPLPPTTSGVPTESSVTSSSEVTVLVVIVTVTSSMKEVLVPRTPGQAMRVENSVVCD